MQAIISDIHSNIEALEAVLEDIAQQGPQEILCLGDVVGYGPEPEETIDRIENLCRFCLSGNHDYAVLTRADRFNPLAVEAVRFTRDVLRPGAVSLPRKRARWQFLEELPTRKEEDSTLYVHGSPRDDRNEYILESDLLFPQDGKIRDILDHTTSLLFIGHTHVPGVIGEDMSFWRPEKSGVAFPLQTNAKYIVNVGSVGQPRDGDPRACYVLAYPDRIVYRRVKYDFRKTMKKLAHVGPLSAGAAERLMYGR